MGLGPAVGMRCAKLAARVGLRVEGDTSLRQQE